jgi:hypothetical protein
LEFQSKYGPKRQLLVDMWEHQPPAGSRTFEAHCAEMWDAAADNARRSLLRDVCLATVEVAQQMMPDKGNRHKMHVIITTCLTDVISKGELAVSKSFQEPGGLAEVCRMILTSAENSLGTYPESEIEGFLSALNYDVFNELQRDPHQHRAMMREFRSMYCVEWLVALVGRLQ